MDDEKIHRYGQELYRALRAREVVSPLTEREPAITVEEAYRIQMHLVRQKLEHDGETIIGKKIGVTSAVVQKALAVDQPDFGHLTSAMRFRDGAELPTGSLIQPRAEGEIAFVLERDLGGPGISAADVLAATEKVVACFEIVDSRIRDWKIRIQDTIADNASAALFVLGEGGVPPTAADLVGCRMVLEKNGKPAGEGVGAATMGSPLVAVAWLANTLGAFGIPLRAGEVILSGSLGPLVPIVSGDEMRLQIEGIGAASVRFV
jgi:2-oxopent-4-enoate/cis-2-oxohex-4-enoate hydratase